MEDLEARELLYRLHKYVEEYKPDLPQTIPALANDLATGMELPKSVDSKMLREIEVWYESN